MRQLCRVLLVISLLSAAALTQSLSNVTQSAVPLTAAAPSQPDPVLQAKVLESYGKLPLQFEANRGQASDRIKFYSRTSNYTVFLTPGETILSLHSSAQALRMKLLHSNPTAKIVGVDALEGTSNYFIGSDPKRWQTDVPTYAKVKYQEIYSGIDLVYYGNQQQLEYDFIVAPGADPNRIAFALRGADRIRTDQHGDLVLKTGGQELRWRAPVVYQSTNGVRREIAAHYTIADKNRVSFEIAKYDTSQPLYIDPLLYSTYLGGIGTDIAYAIAVDHNGNAYVAGQTYSPNFPTTRGAFEVACAGKAQDLCTKNGEAFVAKLNHAGTALVYSTYVGGTGGDIASGITVDSSGNAYVTGQTASKNFPVTSGAFQKTCAGKNRCGKRGIAFVTKLNSKGSALVYSTYLGGSGTDWGGSIVLDKTGNAYVTGATTSTDFPVTPGAMQITCADYRCSLGDAFVTKLNPTGSALVYSTFLGGAAIDYGRAIAVDSAGNAYITGGTASDNFPVTPGAFQTVCGDSQCALTDAFVAKLNPTGSALVYSTLVGGNNYDIGTDIVLDSGDNAYVVGWTGSNDFPTMNPLQGYNAGGGDAFITKLNATGSALIFSTYLGGNGQDNGNGIALDSAGNVYVVGTTASTNFPTVNPLQAVNNGDANCFIAKINQAGSALVYSTYLGGSIYDAGMAIALDAAGDAYITGDTASSNFPTKSPFQTVNNGNIDAFVSKIK